MHTWQKFILKIIKCSSYCERYDWSVWVHYSSIKHSAYVTRVHSTYARKLRDENFVLDKIWESASLPLWLENFHGFNSVSNSWTPKKVAAFRSLKMRHLFQRTKRFAELRSGEKPAFGGYASKVCEQLDKLGSKRFQGQCRSMGRGRGARAPQKIGELKIKIFNSKEAQ